MTDTIEPKRVRPSMPNPLLNRFNKMPPETFRMPSHGALYINGELDDEVTDGEVIVYPMTTVDEITMRSPDMLFQGTAIENVFRRCIPQVKKPFDLLSNDIDFLLVCLRMVTYGNTIDIYWECPKCKNGEDHDHTKDDEHLITEQLHEGQETKRVDLIESRPVYTINLQKFLVETDPLDINDEKFKVTLSTGEVVQLRPSTYGEMLQLYQFDPNNKKTPEELTEFIMNGLLAVIQNVDGHGNKKHIKEWAEHLEAPVIKKLHEQVTTANDWGIAEEYTFTCKKCEYTTNTAIPLNPINFFIAPSTEPISL
jgi:hypothetical protein